MIATLIDCDSTDKRGRNPKIPLSRQDHKENTQFSQKNPPPEINKRKARIEQAKQKSKKRKKGKYQSKSQTKNQGKKTNLNQGTSSKLNKIRNLSLLSCPHLYPSTASGSSTPSAPIRRHFKEYMLIV